MGNLKLNGKTLDERLQDCDDEIKSIYDAVRHHIIICYEQAEKMEIEIKQLRKEKKLFKDSLAIERMRHCPLKELEDH